VAEVGICPVIFWPLLKQLLKEVERRALIRPRANNLDLQIVIKGVEGIDYNSKGDSMKARKLFPAAALVLFYAALSLSLACSSDSYSPNSSGNSNPPPVADAVNIAGYAFTPGNLTVKIGTTVTWTNKDNTAHTVTSDDGKFTSSGNLNSGDTYQYTFNTAGTFPYHCTIHPSMTATVTVTP
jgi:plastocyanin